MTEESRSPDIPVPTLQVPTINTPSHNTPSQRVVIEAIYEDGVIKPLTPLDLPPATPILLEVTTRITVVAEPRIQASNDVAEDAPTIASTPRDSSAGKHYPMQKRLSTVWAGLDDSVSAAHGALTSLFTTTFLFRLGAVVLALVLGYITRSFAGDGPLMPRPIVAITAWLGSIAIVLIACHRSERAESLESLGPPWSRVEIVGVLGLFVVALLARWLWNESIPGGLSGDEGSAGLTAVEFLDGHRNNLFSMGWYSFPSLFFTLPAAAIALFGRTYVALRSPSALGGALTVVGLYWFARPLFGRMASALGAALLAGLAYHIHFSRIGLNNIWDGVFLVFIFGLFWRGWQLDRHWYFNAAGVLLGLSQYFYTGARLIPILLLGWVALMLVSDWRIVRRHVPSIISMFLVALVVVLPLGLFYIKHVDEFAAPMNRVSRLVGYSEGKDWFTLTSQATHKSVLRLVLESYRDAALGFVVVPLRMWYDSGTPMLLALPAVFFVLGVVLALYNFRDPRYWPIFLVLLGTMSILVVSQDTPAAQRYILAAPIATLLVGISLTMLMRAAVHNWPRWKWAIQAITIVVISAAIARELYFYFVIYAPTNGQRDRNTQVATTLGHYLQTYPAGSQVFFFGAPRMGYSGFATLPFLAPQVAATDVIKPLTAPPEWTLSGSRVAFVFLPERAGEARLVEQRYPGGSYIWMTNQNNDQLYLLYEVH